MIYGMSPASLLKPPLQAVASKAGNAAGDAADARELTSSNESNTGKSSQFDSRGYDVVAQGGVEESWHRRIVATH